MCQLTTRRIGLVFGDAPPALRRLAPWGATLDAARVWQRLSAAEQNAIGPPGLLLGYSEAVAYRVDGREATPYLAGRHHGGIILQEALEQTAEFRAMPRLSAYRRARCRTSGKTTVSVLPLRLHRRRRLSARVLLGGAEFVQRLRPLKGEIQCKQSPRRHPG